MRVSSCGTVLVQSLEQSVGVIRRVVVYDVLRVVRIYFVDVFSEFAAGLGLDFLDFLESTGLHECPLGLEV